MHCGQSLRGRTQHAEIRRCRIGVIGARGRMDGRRPCGGISLVQQRWRQPAVPLQQPGRLRRELVARFRRPLHAKSLLSRTRGGPSRPGDAEGDPAQVVQNLIGRTGEPTVSRRGGPRLARAGTIFRLKYQETLTLLHGIGDCRHVYVSGFQATVGPTGRAKSLSGHHRHLIRSGSAGATTGSSRRLIVRHPVCSFLRFLP
jgi:hypothetical protein